MSDAVVIRPRPQAAVGRWVLGGVAVVFGVATLLEGGSVLWGGTDARAAAENVVPFVLMFNFGAGFVYVAGGLATLLGRGWSIGVARGLAISTLLVFAAFGFHVLLGGAHETRTLIAMTLRSGFWVAQALLLSRLFEGGRHE